MKKRYWLTLLVAFMLFFVMPDKGISVAAKADATHPGFRVDGRFLYDNQGEKVILYGMNKMCTWMDKDGDPSFKEIAKTGANCVRITWSITDTAADLDTVITNCRAQHMIPIVELHDATGEWGKLSSLVDYWVKDDIAAVLIKHQDYVIVNIGNEVGNSNITDAQFTEDYTTAVSRMRDAGIHVPLMIDGSSWGQNINILQSCGPDLIENDPDHNILLSVHMWWPAMYGHNAQEVIDELTESKEMNLPIIVGEFGHIWEESEAGKIPYKTIMEYCAKLEIGYMAWSWGPGNNPQTFLDMTSDSTFDTLNDYGKEVCLTSQYSIKNLAVRPASMLTNMPPQLPAAPLPYGNLAAGKTATASTEESDGYTASNVTDGNRGTRWASVSKQDPSWVCIDLGEEKDITKMIIVWEGAYASQYKIQVSDNGTDWTDAYQTYSGNGGTEEISLDASGRYIRMYGTQRKNYEWGYSTFEIGVYGPESEASTSIDPVVATFDKNPSVQKDLVITTDPKNNTLKAIKNGDDVLVKGSDYTVDGNTVTIKKAYLCTQPYGETIKLTFDYDNGVDPVLAIAVGDTSPVTVITPTSAQFNKYAAVQEDVNVTVNSTDFTIASITCGAVTLEEGTDYTVSDNALTIKKEFLATLSVGSSQLDIIFGDGTAANLAVNVIYTAPSAVVSPETASFEKRDPADVDITMDLKGNTLASIKNGDYTLVEGTDYMVNDSVVTIKKSYLASLETGKQTLVFGFDQGNDSSVKITITETIPNSTLDTNSTSFSSKEAADLDITMMLNGNTLASIKNGSYTLVEGTDYTVDGSVVTLKADYLASIGVSNTKLTFTFSEGKDQVLTLKNTAVTPSTLKVEYFSCSQSSDMNSIMPRWKLTNTGNEAIDLSDVTLRYYFTKDGSQDQTFWCDWCSAGNSNIVGTFVDMENPTDNADCYLEISFKSDAGTLAAGAEVQVQGRFAKNDWSSYNQSNDYSFGCTLNTYGDWDKVTAYVNRSLISGMEP